MRKCAVLLTLIALTACSSPTITTIDTLCTSTTRYHASEPQREAFKQDQQTWESLVNWLVSFNRVRDAQCLKPSPL